MEKNLTITRGDTGLYAIDLRDANGKIIDIVDNITMYFTVKDNSNSTPFKFQKKSGNGITYSEEDKKFHLVIEPTDTSNLSYGEYVYDITIRKDNSRFTVIKGKFCIEYEVTFIENEG